MLGPRIEKSVCLQHDLSIIRAFIGLNRLNVVATHQEATISAHGVYLRCDERSIAHLDRMIGVKRHGHERPRVVLDFSALPANPTAS